MGGHKLNIMYEIKEEKQQHENIRKEAWLRAWTSVASASDCKSKETPGTWADHMLKEFDKRFPFVEGGQKANTKS